ncbi:MAG TPA: DUF58 domain-containing protein [Fimbriimonas sp.]
MSKTNEGIQGGSSTRNLAGFALSIASAFLAIEAILIGSPALFYMGTAIITMIAASHFQAWLSVKGLRFERVAPETARVGDLVTVEITVWSDRKIRRPLVTIVDNLPPRLMLSHRTPSLPIAAAYDLPIRTQYQFRATKRGIYRWSGLMVEGTDALGLVTKRKIYPTATAEMTVLPRPIPVTVELPNAAGWGISEAESGHTRGAGIEPRGIRAYAPGDSFRQIHWRSSAKTGQLLVKEFEAGSQAAAAFLLQRTKGTDLGSGAYSSFEVMVGHTVFLADTFLRQGARIELPGLESRASHFAPHERIQEIYETMASVQPDQASSVSEEAMSVIGQLPPGSVLFVLLSVRDDHLIEAVAQLTSRGTQVVALLYDASSFVEEPKKTARRKNLPLEVSSVSAVDPGYIEGLRRAGAEPVVMPTEVEVES